MDEREKRRLRRERRKLKRAQGKEEYMSAGGRFPVGVFLSQGEHLTCIVCGDLIKKGETYGRLLPDEKVPEWRYYHWPECGPGTEAWYRFHPSRISELMLKGKEVKREKRLERRARKLGKTINQEKEEKFMKKEKSSGLKPMEPVKVPKAVFKGQSKEVKDLLTKLESIERSSAEARKVRKELRKLGFRLSDFRGELTSTKEKPVPKKETAPSKKSTESKSPKKKEFEEEEE